MKFCIHTYFVKVYKLLTVTEIEFTKKKKGKKLAFVIYLFPITPQNLVID